MIHCSMYIPWGSKQPNVCPVGIPFGPKVSDVFTLGAIKMTLESRYVRSGKLTWDLNIGRLKKTAIYKGRLFRFHVYTKAK